MSKQILEAGYKDKSSILVFGANGLLGSRICESFSVQGFDVVRQSRNPSKGVSCDPQNEFDVAELIRKIRPKAIINLIANSNVDHCEQCALDAYIANARSVDILARAIGAANPRPHLIHISTDQVYSGKGPHQEKEVAPVNIYAMTKLVGECFALRVGGTVLRTSFFGKSNCERRLSFTDWIYDALTSGRKISVFSDVLFSALHMQTLSRVILKSIIYRRTGIFNVGTRDGISKADFALAFARNLGLDLTLLKTETIAVAALKARRPLDMTLNVAAYESEFDHLLPRMHDEISLAADEYRSYL